MRSPPASVDAAENHREGSGWSSALTYSKEAKETERAEEAVGEQ